MDGVNTMRSGEAQAGCAGAPQRVCDLSGTPARVAQEGPQRRSGSSASSSPVRRVYLFINGIHVRPGDAEGWCDRAVTWTHIKTEARAEKFEYATWAVTRWLHQQERAEKFAR